MAHEQSFNELFELYDRLNAMNAFTESEEENLSRLTRDDVNGSSLRWSPSRNSNHTGEISDSDKSDAFMVMVDVMTVLSNITDAGAIDSYDFTEVITFLCHSIERNNLPISYDVDEYVDYFNDNSPIAEEESSY